MKVRIPLAELSEGKMITREIDGVDVMVCRIEGEYYALLDRCSHARQKLSEGRLRGHQVTCPLHGARFDVRDGACLSPPASQPVRALQVVCDGDAVEVTVNPEDKPPKPRFGPLN